MYVLMQYLWLGLSDNKETHHLKLHFGTCSGMRDLWFRQFEYDGCIEEKRGILGRDEWYVSVCLCPLEL